MKRNLILLAARQLFCVWTWLPQGAGALRAASFPFAGRGSNTVSRERGRAEVSGGSSRKSCGLAELIVC